MYIFQSVYNEFQVQPVSNQCDLYFSSFQMYYHSPKRKKKTVQTSLKSFGLKFILSYSIYFMVIRAQWNCYISCGIFCFKMTLRRRKLCSEHTKVPCGSSSVFVLFFFSGFLLIMLPFWLVNYLWPDSVLNRRERRGICYEPVKCCTCLWHIQNNLQHI